MSGFSRAQLLRQIATVLQLVVGNVGAIALLLLTANALSAVINGVHFRDPELMHETEGRDFQLAPNRLRIARSEFHGAQLNIDRDGWRTGQKAGSMFDHYSPDDYNIFLFGGSALYGYTVDDNDTIPAYLDAELKRRGNTGVHAYNFGSLGYALLDETNVLVELIRENRIPKVAIFYDGGNEFGRGLRGEMPGNVFSEWIDADYTYENASDLFEAGRRSFNPQNLALATFAVRLRTILTRWGFFPNTNDRYKGEISAEEQERLAKHAKAAAKSYMTKVELVEKLASAYGFKAIFVLQPMGVCLENHEQYPFRYFGPPQRYQALYYQFLYEEIMRLANRHKGSKVTNLCSALNGEVSKGRRLFSTKMHLNGEGNRFIAGILADIILTSESNH